MIAHPEFFYYFNIILIGRLFFQFRDNPITLKQTVYKIILELAALLIFSLNWWVASVLLVMAIINISGYVIENRTRNLKLWRLSFLILNFVIFAFLFSTQTNIRFNPSLLAKFGDFESGFILISVFKQLDWARFFIMSTGVLLVLNEANIFIRYLMESLQTVPQRKLSKQKEEIDTREYNRGRVIGILERILIFYFVLNSFLSAVGFILAAKGITRFKELENREFAEYFLIGTLLSAIISGAIALLIRSIL